MFATTLAAAILSITTPAPSGAAAPAAPAAGQSDAIVGQAAKGRYNPRVCIVDYPTGTRIPTKTCKLLAQWRTDNIDPLPGK